MQLIKSIKKWIWDGSESAQNSSGNTENETNQDSLSNTNNVSELGVKMQKPANWLKKSIYFLFLIALGFWAITYFSDSNPLSGIWNKTNENVKHLEANINATGESVSNIESVEGISSDDSFSMFRLPNGENVEFKTGSFEHSLTAFIGSNDQNIDQSFTFDNLNFEDGSAVLKEESIVQLNNLANILGAYASVKIRIEGHTDNVGNAAANKLLSAQRAESVKEYLVTYANIYSKRIITQGWGCEKPIANNEIPAERIKNIRTDLVITQK